MTPDRPPPAPQRARRPLLMDPASPASGFAPPAGAPRPAEPLFTPSVLAAPDPAATAARPVETAFGPVSQVARISVRTITTRIDLVLPDRCSVAETLEAVLELSPTAVREQAIAHGGWTLRRPDGTDLPGEATLLDLGITDGSTVLLTGLDSGAAAPVYDDMADAVADTVSRDPSAWPRAAGRRVALAAAGVFAATALAPLLVAGPPWAAVTLALAGLTVVAQLAAGLLSRGAGDAGAALVAGLVSVATGSAAATLATAGSARLPDVGPAQLLLGAGGAVLCATTAAVAIGTRLVPLAAIITAAAVVGTGLSASVLLDLPPAGGAAVVAGICLALLPLAPWAALRFARFRVPPLPSTAEDVLADESAVDPDAVAHRTRLALGNLTALVQGLSWPALAASVVLATAGDVTAQALAAVTGLALTLRARLFGATGQRLPLLIAGIGSTVAVLLGVAADRDGLSALVWVSVPALLMAVACLALAMRRAPVSPGTRRVGEILDVLLAVAMVPLVAAVLGLFGLIRGLGG